MSGWPLEDQIVNINNAGSLRAGIIYVYPAYILLYSKCANYH